MHYKQGKGKSGRGRKRCFCFLGQVGSGSFRPWGTNGTSAVDFVNGSKLGTMPSEEETTFLIKNTFSG